MGQLWSQSKLLGWQFWQSKTVIRFNTSEVSNWSLSAFLSRAIAINHPPPPPAKTTFVCGATFFSDNILESKKVMKTFQPKWVDTLDNFLVGWF